MSRACPKIKTEGVNEKNIREDETSNDNLYFVSAVSNIVEKTEVLGEPYECLFVWYGDLAQSNINTARSTVVLKRSITQMKMEPGNPHSTCLRLIYNDSARLDAKILVI